LDDNFLGNKSDFEAHIVAQSSGLVRVEGGDFSSTAPINIVANKNNGISAFNTDVTVREKCLGPVNMFTGCEGPMDKTSFAGFTNAILSSNSGTFPVLQVSNSMFADNYKGITVNGVNSHKLILNHFALTLSEAFGVFVSHATGFKIEENSFDKNRSAPYCRIVGLMVRNSGIAENEVYKNTFSNLTAGQLFYECNGSVGTPYTGLQSLCNEFHDNTDHDILVGDYPYMPLSTLDHSIRKLQGNSKIPAGNLFYGNPASNIKVLDALNAITYHYGKQPEENPLKTTNVTKTQTFISYACPSKMGLYESRGTFDLEHALLQYDAWNAEYEYWLAQLNEFEDENAEEYNTILEMVSYYSALKDNYFNGIIVAVMDEEAEGRREKGEGNDEMMRGLDDEMIKEKESNFYELLRFLFSYRNHYTDNLSIVETYLAESNYSEAQVVLSSMYEQFEVTSEQVNELTGLQEYVFWLQQLEAAGGSIYKLNEREIVYLINYVETNTGRGVVFANNILCA